MSNQIQGQAFSAAAKRRAHRARMAQMAEAAAKAGVPALARGATRERDGRAYRPPSTRDPQRDMFKARCRRWGKPTSKWSEMRDPWWGCEAGGAMAQAVDSLAERKALWDAICWMRQTIIALDRALGAPNRHAQCLKLLLPSEEMSADSTSPEPDHRTDEEKEDAAVQAYQWLGEILGRCGERVKAECLRVVVDDEKARDLGALIYGLRNISRHIDPRALT